MTGAGQRFRGTPVSEGIAAGLLFLADAPAASLASPGEIAAAFAAVAADRAALADRLSASGRDEEAEIVRIAALIAADPALAGPAVAAATAGVPAAEAIGRATEAQAAVLAALDNPDLAERAGDVRQVGQAVLEHLAGGAADPPDGDFILVRREVAAADLITFAEAGMTGAVSAAGGASSHAAIIARGLGLPMITGLDPAVLDQLAGCWGTVDADAGTLSVRRHGSRPVRSAGPAPQERPGRPVGARTADGERVILLCNVASAAETRLGLAAGAAGVGLLRTEIPFAGALAWPTRPEHAKQLVPILNLLPGRPATVRLLDFSGDKIPPFLRRGRPAAAGGSQPGLAALLAHPTALADQLAAVLTTGKDTDLAVLVPMVSSLAEVAAVRRALSDAASAVGCRPPQLGIMIELARTAEAATAFAAAADFFSIGTNDLSGDVLALGRKDRAARPALTADPRVLALIGQVVTAAAAAGIPVSVCGDAAADTLVLPLLLGLGVRALSVPAARVGRVRGWVAGLDTVACAGLAAKACAASAADEVWEMVRHAGLS